MLPSLKTLLWIDCIAAFLSGSVVALTKSYFAPILELPETLLTSLSLISIVYGCYSLSLALQKNNRKGPLYFLVGANAAYATLCFGLAIVHCCNNYWGVAYLLADSSVVAVLATVEWKRFSLGFPK